MNLFELLFFLLMSAGLLGLGYFLSAKWRIIGWLIGAVPVGLVLGAVLLGTIKSTLTALRHNVGSRPVCRQGKCQSRNYVLIDSTSERTMFRCRCGDKYVQQGNRFLQIFPDGSWRPYMVHDASKAWTPDASRLQSQ